MAEVTLTELRKNLFHLVDQMVETGRPLKVRRNGRTISLSVTTEDATPPEPTPEDRFAAWMAKGPREGCQDWDYDPDDKSHWTWDPDTKFRDL
jgi:hypothetical protein